jgi:hypothetical protein
VRREEAMGHRRHGVRKEDTEIKTKAIREVVAAVPAATVRRGDPT